MGRFKVKRDKADETFSLYVRLRDRTCQRCGSFGRPDAKGRPVVGLQASHFWGRAKESVRFDEKNVMALCGGCHMYLTANPEIHRQFVLDKLGKKEYDLLELRARTLKKKDRKMELIIAKALLENLNATLSQS